MIDGRMAAVIEGQVGKETLAEGGNQRHGSEKVTVVVEVSSGPQAGIMRRRTVRELVEYGAKLYCNVWNIREWKPDR